MTTIRSFIAISLTDEARSKLNHLQARLKESLPRNTVRWTAPKNIHLTLHFLGHVATDDIRAVTDTLRHVCASHTRFSLILSNLGCFPNTRRPRIVWVGLSGETEMLVALQRSFSQPLKDAIGFQPESRPYSPHLTIGRIKKGLTNQGLAELGSYLEKEIRGVGHLVALPVDHVHFIRSELKPDGPVYTSLATESLGKAF